jgi:cytochrome c oxidase subunit 4
MSERTEASGAIRRLWGRNLLIWIALLALLAVSLVLAYIPMGRLTTAIGVVIAVAKSTLVVLFFMELASAKSLIRLAAISGLIFLAAMFALTLADVLARP